MIKLRNWNKLVYILLTLFSVGCFFWQPTITKHYIKDMWSFFKDDSVNNVVIYKMLNYDEEKDISTIKLKFINKNDSLYVFVSYQLEITLYRNEENRLYRKKETRILVPIEREDKIFFHRVQPFGYTEVTLQVEGVRVIGIFFYLYEVKKLKSL